MKYKATLMDTYRYINFAKHVDSFDGIFEGNVLGSGNDDGALASLALIPMKKTTP